MTKTNYQVTFNAKVVGIRKSDRIYTHAVVVQDDAHAFHHWAHNYVPNETDRNNFAYDSKRAVQIVEQYLAEWKYQKPHYVESQISEAKAKVEGGFEGYAKRLRQEKIQMYEDRLAKGGFLPYVARWCGRPDLAQKASTQRDFVGPRYWGRTNFLAIVPIEIAPAKVKDVSEEENDLAAPRRPRTDAQAGLKTSWGENDRVGAYESVHGTKRTCCRRACMSALRG